MDWCKDKRRLVSSSQVPTRTPRMLHWGGGHINSQRACCWSSNFSHAYSFSIVNNNRQTCRHMRSYRYFMLNHLRRFLVQKCFLTFVSFGFYRSGRKTDCLGCIYTQQGEHMNDLCRHGTWIWTEKLAYKAFFFSFFFKHSINLNFKRENYGSSSPSAYSPCVCYMWGSVLSGCAEVLVSSSHQFSSDGGWAGRRRRHAPLRVRLQQARGNMPLKIIHPSVVCHDSRVCECT